MGSRRTGLGFLNVQRVVALHDTFDSRKPIGVALNDSFLSSIIRRTYATTTKPVSRPKAHTGRTTTAARKAPTTSKTKAAKKPAVKKTAPKAIPKDGPEAVPKTKPKARTTAKPTAKPRIKPKPKSAKKAKAKPKSKRKTLTQVEKDEKLHKDLKAAALKPPHGTPATAWTVFNAEAVKSNGVGGGFAQAIRESAAQFKNLSPERLEVLSLTCVIGRSTDHENSITTTLPIKTRQQMPWPIANGSNHTHPRSFTKPTLHGQVSNEEK